jgi:Zn-dependent protease
VPLPNEQTLGVGVCSMAIIMNISLFLFNLCIPAYPLDGGRILVSGARLAVAHL